MAPNAPAAIEENDGIAYFEAESFTQSVARGSQQWQSSTSVAGYSGAAYMEALPNAASNINAAVSTTSPELQYGMQFNTPGTYRVWVRGHGLDGTEDSVHVGLDGGFVSAGSNLGWTVYGAWTWTNGASKNVTVGAAGLHTFNLWMREDGARVDRLVLATNAAFRPVIGNAWHIPSNYEPDLPRPTMRFPLHAIESNTAVEIYNGNQFRGSGNPGNQLGIGSAVIYKVATNSVWTELPMAFVAQGTVNTNNKYFGTTLAAGLFQPGDVVQYYLRIPYDDHLPTYLYGSDATGQETETESVAQASPYTFTVQSSYLSVSTMIPEGEVQARVFTNSGDIAVTGPDLAGSPFATTVYYRPGAKIGGVTYDVGAVVAAFPIAGGWEMSQQLHTGIVTARLTVVAGGVVRYEIIHFGNLAIQETRIRAPSDSGEHLFGLGEKFNSVDQTGRNTHIMTYDPAGDKNDLSYKVVPWYMSTRGYGFHLDSSAESYFDLRASRTSEIQVSNLFASLAFNVIYGPHLTNVLSRYTGYSGRPAMTPPWAYGTWMSSDHWRDGGEVRYVVTKFRELGLPGSAFVFDSPWEIAYNDLTWNMTQFGAGGNYSYNGVSSNYAGFASLTEMMEFFRSNGWKVICWMTPFINRSSNNEGVPGANTGVASTYTFASNNGYFVRNGAINGPALVTTWWKGSGSPVDFTRASAANWWMGQLSNLVAQSGGVIGGWKTDDGESRAGGDIYIPTYAHYSDGRTGIEMRNGFCVEYHKTVWNVLGTNGILFARSGFTGSQSYPGYWSGDNDPNFGAENGILSVMTAAQSAGLCGYSILGHDIGGYRDNNISSSFTNLFLRWTQFGAFTPLFQMHRKVTDSMQYPWSFGAPALNHFRFYSQLHQSLFPYIYTYAKRSAESGLPIIRHPVLLHQQDAQVYGVDHSYFFGDELYVAPATAPNQTVRSLYLPQGYWYDFWTNRTYAGAQLVDWTNTDQTKVAVFVRAGAIIPTIATNILTLQDAAYIGHSNLVVRDDAIDFLVYPDTNSVFAMYDGTVAQCSSNSTVVTLDLTSAARPVSMRLRGGAPAGVQRDGVRLPACTSATEFAAAQLGWWHDPSGFVRVKFAHPGGATQVRMGPDSVGDGIPNSWRQLFFTNAASTDAVSCATCDPDGDGHNNAQEYLAGTDPTSTGSVMRVAQETPSAGPAPGVTIAWPSRPGIPYRLDWKADLSDATSWNSITSRFTGDGGSLNWTDDGTETANTGGWQRYYRIHTP